MSQHTIKPQYSRQCATGVRKDQWTRTESPNINRTENQICGQ